MEVIPSSSSIHSLPILHLLLLLLHLPYSTMNTTQEEAAFDVLRDFNSTALAQVVQDWVRLLQMTLLVYFIIIGLLLSIIITCGTVGWANGWFNEDEQDDDDDDDDEEVDDEENDDTLSSSSHVAVEIGEEDEDVVELASISSISVHSDPRSLPRPEEEEESRLNDNRHDSEDDDEAENHGWMGNCYMS